MSSIVTELRDFARCANDDSNPYLADFLERAAGVVERMELALEHCEALLMREEINSVDGEELADKALELIRAARKPGGAA